MPPGNAVAPGAGNVQVTPVPLSDLQTGATYHYRIVASNAVGKTFGQDEVVTTAERPSINNLSTENVKATSAELKAVINPMKGETSYHFEYGPTTAYGTSVPIPDESIGTGSSDVSVTAALSGLEKEVTYHFRVVAQNQYGTVSSGDQTFGFYPPPCPNAQLRGETASNHLPDCRAYELVTPSYAAGTIIFPSGGPTTPYATDPPRLSFVGSYGSIPGSGNPINTNGDLYVSTRTETEWKTKYIGLPPEQTLEMGGPPRDFVTSISQHGPTDIQIGVQSTIGLDRILSYDRSPPLSYDYPDPARPPSNVPYLWSSSTNQQLGRWPTNVDDVEGRKRFKGTPIASADFTHFVFSSDVVFAGGGVATTIPWQLAVDPLYALPCCSASIYDNNTVTGEVEHISVKADGTTPFLGDPIDVSDDGKVIVMGEGVEATIRKPAPLFVRIGGQTYDIAPGYKVLYVGSSADGRTLYVESSDQLTGDDEDASNDLFMWEASNPTALTRVSIGTEGDSGNSDACSVGWTQGCGILTIPFKKYAPDPISEFFEYWNLYNGQGGNGVTDSAIAANGDIYFQSPEQLEGAKGELERTNLYRFADGQVEFVATLKSAAPTCSELYGVFCSQGPIARMQITRDGRYMAFLTSSQVTAYDNAGHIEMYLYSPETKRLTCPSCVADGGVPKFDVYGSQNGLFLTDDGRVGFSTKEALVPQDTNGSVDTYEYVEGRQYLISNGLGEVYTEGVYTGLVENLTAPGLVHISADGSDFYFASYEHLVSQDHNGQEIKIYDARTNGGFPAEVPRADCQAADECHGPGNSPPPVLPDRTSAQQGVPARAKAKKPKSQKAKHKAKKRKKKRRGKPTRSAATKRGGR